MSKKVLLSCAMIAAFAAAANAQTVIRITGATAFRQGATAAINSVFAAGSNPFVAIHNGGLNGGNLQAWRGTFGSLGANVTIVTRWNGSTEGLRAVAQPSQTIDGLPTNPSFFNPSILDTLTPAANFVAVGVNTSGNTSAQVAHMSFSDVRIQATPIPGTLAGGPVGVVTFTMVASKSWRHDPRTYAITNITSQQFRTVFEQGRVPLSYFTGNESDTEYVYASGRNDGSGTRTTYLAETGYGISKPVQQYVGFDRANSTVLPSILLVPQDGGFLANTTATATNRSTLWNQNVDGNGGYVSGNDLRADFAKLTENTSVHQLIDDGDGNRTFAEIEELYPAAKLFMISWLSTADAATARGTGLELGAVNSTLTYLGNSSVANAVILGYEGVRYNDLATTGNATLTAADRARATSGQTSAWSNQQLLHVSGNATLATAFSIISAAVPGTIGAAGIPTTSMNVGRTVDGGIIGK